MQNLTYNLKRNYSIQTVIYQNNNNNTTLYRAYDNTLKRTVVIKEITVQDRTVKESIEKEILNMILVEEKTEDVPTIYDYFFDANNNKFYIAMQHIKGSSLKDVINEQQGKSASLATIKSNIALCKQICNVMSRIHQIPGFCHKDLKPENIIVNRIGYSHNVHIIDFGISGFGAFRGIGTNKYMAPEQLNFTKEKIYASQATDVFALGLIIYEIFSDKLPDVSLDFEYKRGSDRWERMPSILNDNIKAPKELEAILNKALAFNPKDRYKNAGELSSALKKVN